MVQSLYKDRVSVLVDIWGTLLQNWPNLAREWVITHLSEKYRERRIRPIRGFKAENVYEKELISLYIVGKFGLGVEEENPQLLNTIFEKEIYYEKIANALSASRLEEALGIAGNDRDALSRSLRFSFTKFLFSFSTEEELIRAIRTLASTTTDEIAHVGKSFSRFYIGFRIAEGIATKSIRDRLSMDAMEKALQISLGFKTPYPKPEYIALIAREVFGVHPKILKRITNATGDELIEKHL